MVVATPVKVRRTGRKVNLNKFRNQPLTPYQRASLMQTLKHTRNCYYGVYPDYNPNLGNRRSELMDYLKHLTMQLILN